MFLLSVNNTEKEIREAKISTNINDIFVHTKRQEKNENKEIALIEFGLLLAIVDKHSKRSSLKIHESN